MQKLAGDIIKKDLGEDAVKVVRYETGYCHYVHYVETDRNNRYVVRISRSDTIKHFNGSLYWLGKLAPLGIPIPQIITHGTQGDYSYTVLKHIPGKDLGEVYSSLSDDDKQGIARDLVKIQNTVGTLPEADGFGYLFSYDDPRIQKSWKDVLHGSVQRSRQRILKNGIFDVKLCDAADRYLGYFDGYLAAVKPRPFLDDTTTKNVLVDGGKLSGVIDIDAVCFGDPLWTVALTNMALLGRGMDTRYIDFWTAEMAAEDMQMQVLKLYTLLFCLDFMGEKGMLFNKEVPLAVSPEEKELFLEIYHNLVGQLDQKTMK